MKHLNFLSSLGSQSGSHRVVTLASTVGSPSAHRRGTMLKHVAFLLLFLFSFGVGNVWGGSKTYSHDFTAKPTENADNTLSTITWTVSATNNLNGYQASYKGVQVGAKSKNGAITLTTKNNWGAQTSTTYHGYTNVKKVYVWLNAGSATPSASVSVGGTAATSDGATVSKNTSASGQRNGTSKVTFTPASGHTTGAIAITVTTSNGAGYLCAIEVECEEPTESCSNQVTITNSATTNTTHGSFDVDKTGAQDACSALSVVVTPNPDDHYHVASVSASNPATSGTAGTAVDNGDGTYTITYSANAKGNSTISVTFEENTKHSVTWKVNNSPYSTGNPSSEVYDGEKIATFPTVPSSCQTGKEFVGWSATAICLILK